jgi:hypothetical protein
LARGRHANSGRTDRELIAGKCQSRPLRNGTRVACLDL